MSLATVNGRVECEYDLPDNTDSTLHGEYLLNEDYSFSTSTVHYDSDADEFYLHATMERQRDVDSPEKAEDSNVLGVDCNVTDHIVPVRGGSSTTPTPSTISAENSKNGVPASNKPAREAPT